MRSFLFSIPFILIFSINSVAQPGTLDQSFGNGGKVTTDFTEMYDRGESVAIQIDGKIIVVGNSTDEQFFSQGIELVRYFNDGKIDSSFGVFGKVITDFGGVRDRGYSVAITADNKIVAIGQSNGRIGIAKYHNNGSLDSSFGIDGKVLTSHDSLYLEANTVKILANQEIIVSGTGRAVQSHYTLVKYKINGTVDSSFGKNGFATNMFDESRATCNSMSIYPNERILLIGDVVYDNIGREADFAMTRFEANGRIDSSFGNYGKSITRFSTYASYAKCVAINPDNKILLSGETYDYTSNKTGLPLAKYNDNGKLDSSFGTDGKILDTTILRGAYAILLTGEFFILAGQMTNNPDFFVSRHHGNGDLDQSFGNNGLTRTDFANGYEFVYDAILQPDGKILVVGNSFTGISNDFALARYTNNTILPITLSSFTAAKKQNSVLLNWQTASESNNSYFAIERSNNNSNFKELGKVNSKGNSTQVQQYSFEDHLPLNGVNYYRLRQVNKDGTATTSKTVLVDVSKAPVINLYPNPVKNVITIEGLTGKKTTISIIDINGRVLTTTSTNDATYTWNIKALPQGTYYLRTEADKKVSTVKFVKE